MRLKILQILIIQFIQKTIAAEKSNIQIDSSIEYEVPNLSGRLILSLTKISQDVNTEETKYSPGIDPVFYTNKEFKKFNQELSKAGFNQSDIKINKNGNETLASFEYQNKQNETAKINVKVKNDKIVDVTLEKSSNRLWWWLFFLLIPVLFLLYKKRNEEVTPETKPKKKIDYKKTTAQ